MISAWEGRYTYLEALFGSREIIKGNPKRTKTRNIAVGWLHCNILKNAVQYSLNIAASLQ